MMVLISAHTGAYIYCYSKETLFKTKYLQALIIILLVLSYLLQLSFCICILFNKQDTILYCIRVPHTDWPKQLEESKAGSILQHWWANLVLLNICGLRKVFTHAMKDNYGKLEPVLWLRELRASDKRSKYTKEHILLFGDKVRYYDWRWATLLGITT